MMTSAPSCSELETDVRLHVVGGRPTPDGLDVVPGMEALVAEPLVTQAVGSDAHARRAKQHQKQREPEQKREHRKRRRTALPRREQERARDEQAEDGCQHRDGLFGLRPR
jgi:hypothetical protein